MSDSKDFVAGIDSNAKKISAPRRLHHPPHFGAGQGRRRRAAADFPRGAVSRSRCYRGAGDRAGLDGAFVQRAARRDCRPSHTPNPAKAPWYFLGLQEMLHYFPPVVAGVLVPGLVVMALIVIPYFNINIEAEGLFLKDRQNAPADLLCRRRSRLSLFLLFFNVYVALVPDAHHGRAHDDGGAEFAAVSFGLPALSGCETALVLGHDLVSCSSWWC